MESIVVERESELQLSNEDKIRIIKSMILLFLFSTMIVSSMAYYNAPNVNPNLVFESGHDSNAKHDKHVHNYPVYKLNSRYSFQNIVTFEIALERIGRTNNINSDYYRNIKMALKFSKNKVRVKINESDSKQFEIPSKYAI